MRRASSPLARGKKYSFLACALAGLLGGLNLTQFSGLLELPSFSLTFPALTSSEKSSLSAALLLGALLSTFAAGPLVDSQGRRASLLISGALFFAGTSIVASAASKSALWSGRFISGCGFSVGNIVAPAYLTENAPSAQRAAFVNLYQLSINVGIVTSEILNALGVNVIASWRSLAAFPILPATILFILTYAFFDNNADVAASAAATPSDDENNAPRNSFALMRSDRSAPRRIMVAAGLMGAQQITAINGVLFFAPSLIMKLGMDPGNSSVAAPFWASVLIGLTNALASFFAMYAIESSGRRNLLIRGGATICGSLLVIGLVRWNEGPSLAGLLGLILFIAAFATSWGPLPFLISAEVLPKSYRGLGLAFAGVFSHVTSFSVVSAFLRLEQSIGEFVYGLFAALMAVCTILVIKWLPETKSLSLEDIDALFSQKSQIGAPV